MEDKDILWRAYEIIKGVCEEEGYCSQCPLYESCQECECEPHLIIRDFWYDLYDKKESETDGT